MSATVASVGTVATGDGVSSLASNAPSGVTSGDLLILCVGTSSPVATITTPTNWTQISNASDGFSAMRGAFYRRIADGGGDDTPTVGFGSNTDCCSVILRITGQDASTPFDAAGTPYTQTGGTTITLPTVTTAEDDELLIAVTVTDGAVVNSTPSGWTQRANFDLAGSVDISMRVWSRAAPSAGSHGGETHTVAFSDQAVAFVAAFKSGVSDTVPEITSDGAGATATLHVADQQTAVTTVTATGTPTPTFSITGGADSADFSIHSTTGVLTFNSAPNYYSPADADTNSIYVVEVTATNTAGTDVQTITVVVYPTSTETPPAPLDDAEYAYRFLVDHIAGNTQYPNFGTRSEPLVLGDDYTADAQTPDWVADGTLGDHLLYTTAADSYAHAAAPEAIIDAASFTVAVRVRWDTLFTTSNLFNVMRDIGTDTKAIFLHKQADQTYEGRVWDGTTESQVAVISTTAGTTSTTDSVVLTYDGTTRELLIYVNGTEEDSAVADNPRALVGDDYFLEWPVGVGLAAPTLCPDCKYFRMAFWDRCLTPTEVDDLESNAWWISDGGVGGTILPLMMHMAGS